MRLCSSRFWFLYIQISRNYNRVTKTITTIMVVCGFKWKSRRADNCQSDWCYRFVVASTTVEWNNSRQWLVSVNAKHLSKLGPRGGGSPGYRKNAIAHPRSPPFVPRKTSNLQGGGASRIETFPPLLPVESKLSHHCLVIILSRSPPYRFSNTAQTSCSSSYIC